jgi:hypothetical protein
VVWPKPDDVKEVDPVSEDQAGALLLFGAQIKDPSLDGANANANAQAGQ